MNVFGWVKRRGSAPIARDRLKILLTHERMLGGRSDLLAVLREEIVAVICRHLTVAPEQVKVKMDRGAAVSKLDIDIEIPFSQGTLVAAGAS
jgi:cell division topological specificity factor